MVIKSKAPIIIRRYLGQLTSFYNPLLGPSFSYKRGIIDRFDKSSKTEKQSMVFQNLKSIVNFAYAHITFYRDYYIRNHFSPSCLNSFDDIRRIPPVNKTLLLQCPLEERCLKVQGAVKVNTGGSSGHTLSFYTSPAANHELAHMITIWEKLGYKNSDLKLVMNGHNAVEYGIDFCFRSNSLRMDIYKEFSQLMPKLKQLLRTYPIRFLHGYPSLMYELAVYCDEHDSELRDLLRKSLKGAFLGSEYPHILFRDKIEDVFRIRTVNWYGHTEGAVLAYEKHDKYRYYPFHTYGFAEINEDGHLIASSYFNIAAPFIRYDTEDIITEAEIKDGFLNSFGIKEGRNGEYVTDKNGKRISLTALIFGRHHKLFDYCTHIQVSQIDPGTATIIFVPREQNRILDPETLFDQRNIELDFIFQKRDNPIRTKSGKLNLLVRTDRI